jgi:hypothetical protein
MEKRTVLFILDGGPTEEFCSDTNCVGASVGTFEIVDDATNERLASVNLCHNHAKQFATGYVGVSEQKDGEK